MFSVVSPYLEKEHKKFKESNKKIFQKNKIYPKYKVLPVILSKSETEICDEMIKNFVKGKSFGYEYVEKKKYIGR